MKVLFFGDDIRKLRRMANSLSYKVPGLTYGLRTPSEFNAEAPEPTDFAVVDGKFPEIENAYPAYVEPVAQEKPAPVAPAPVKPAKKARA